MKLSKLVLITGSLLLTASHIRAQDNVCRLTYAYLDKETHTLASIHDVATFSFKAGDKEVMKSFYHEESGTHITVAAQIPDGDDRRGKRYIGLAIAFGEPEFRFADDLFRYVDSAVAETVYDRTDSRASVSRIVDTPRRTYRFRFGCMKGKRK
ncbi:MAG: hypothetical protein ACJ741_21495 [Pyrinomonadaceae bacterium]